MNQTITATYRDGDGVKFEDAAQEARRWLRFSFEDLKAAQWALSKRSSAPRYVCSWSQQSAENAIKGALMLEGIEFPYTRDLDTVRNLLPVGWAVRDAHPNLSDLTTWGVESRYPGNWDEPTWDDAIRAERVATEIYESVSAEFGRRGIAISRSAP